MCTQLGVVVVVVVVEKSIQDLPTKCVSSWRGWGVRGGEETHSRCTYQMYIQLVGRGGGGGEEETRIQDLLTKCVSSWGMGGGYGGGGEKHSRPTYQMCIQLGDGWW